MTRKGVSIFGENLLRYPLFCFFFFFFTLLCTFKKNRKTWKCLIFSTTFPSAFCLKYNRQCWHYRVCEGLNSWQKQKRVPEGKAIRISEIHTMLNLLLSFLGSGDIWRITNSKSRAKQACKTENVRLDSVKRAEEKFNSRLKLMVPISIGRW